eukprot:snap_masked-scaffold_35-processed-gene-1.27-mRNA-1 protein AED:1.00 eAED:1.00 QI:0/-1/0/0/-1/1/1/0/175
MKGELEIPPAGPDSFKTITVGGTLGKCNLRTFIFEIALALSSTTMCSAKGLLCTTQELTKLPTFFASQPQKTKPRNLYGIPERALGIPFPNVESQDSCGSSKTTIKTKGSFEIPLFIGWIHLSPILNCLAPWMSQRSCVKRDDTKPDIRQHFLGPGTKSQLAIFGHAKGYTHLIP